MPSSPFRLRIAPSPMLAGALSLAHGTALGCIVLFLPGWWMPLLAATCVAASLVFHIRRDALQLSADSVIELVLLDGARCELTFRNGQTLAGTVEISTFVTLLLTVINVSPEGRGRHRTIVLMPDSASSENLRRIRVWLRHRIRLDAPASGPP